MSNMGKKEEIKNEFKELSKEFKEIVKIIDEESLRFTDLMFISNLVFKIS